VNVGTASVKITGINDYENTLDRTVTFDIVPTGVTNFVVSASNENSVSLKWDANKNASAYKLQIYKNKSWSTLAKTDKTSYTVKNLSSASDYKFRVAPYKTINSYDYTGSYVYATGTTYPAKVSSLSSTAISSNYITLSWTKQKSATGYRVYKYNYSKKAYEYYKEIPSGSTNTLKVTALSANTKYKFRVRAYKTDTNGKRLYGSYCSGVTFYTAPATPTLKSATSSSSKKVKVKWKSVSGVSGYQVRWSTTKDFSSNYKSTLVDASNTSTTIKTASSKKYYYVKVRSYKTRNGEREYSSWSKIIKVWVK
jgi:hypothetical protein